MKILITGASGFLGSRLTNHLLGAGLSVDILVRSTSSISSIEKPEALNTIGRCDTDKQISDYVRKANPNFVIHAACSYGRRGETYAEILRVNYDIGRLILKTLLSRESNSVCYFINIGTVLKSNVGMYAYTKNRFTNFAKKLFAGYRKNVVFINIELQHIYGVGDDSSKFISYVISRCKSGVERLDLTAGEQLRDFIYIDDVLSALCAIINNIKNIPNMGYINFELGSGKVISIHELVSLIKRETGSNTCLNFGAISYREDEPMYLRADIKMLMEIGWSPKIGIEEGIKKMMTVDCIK